MALIPRALRPGVLIRRKALHDGVFGPSTFWKAVAVVVFGKRTLKRLFGKNEEVLDTITFKGGGHLLQVETIAPAGRRERRRRGRTGKAAA